jgi:hypothetical protein
MNKLKEFRKRDDVKIINDMNTHFKMLLLRGR